MTKNHGKNSTTRGSRKGTPLRAGTTGQSLLRVKLVPECDFTPAPPNPILEAIKDAARDGTIKAAAASRAAGIEPATLESIRTRRGADKS